MARRSVGLHRQDVPAVLVLVGLDPPGDAVRLDVVDSHTVLHVACTGVVQQEPDEALVLGDQRFHGSNIHA